MSTDIHEFRPLEYLVPGQGHLGLIILNQDIGDCTHHLKTLWTKAIIRGVADGGIDRLHEAVSDHDLYKPDFISGDFDSASESLLELYRKKCVGIIHTPDQNKTDFTKCLDIMIERWNMLIDATELSSIVVLAGLGGRFDHQMANINTCVRALSLFKLPIYLHDRSSLAVVLRPGANRIYHKSSYEGDWCGLVPLERARVTTSGLEWNLNDQYLEFGGLISTSNKTDSSCDHVNVFTDRPILWTMGIK